MSRDLLNLFIGAIIGGWLHRVRPIGKIRHAAWDRGISGWTPSRYPPAWNLVWIVLNPAAAFWSWRRHNPALFDL